MVTPLKKVPLHLQSAANRLLIKNGVVVNDDGEEQMDIYIEVTDNDTDTPDSDLIHTSCARTVLSGRWENISLFLVVQGLWMLPASLSFLEELT